jgi:hypothetical protein
MMSDFRSRVKEDLIKNKVPVIKYSLEEHICDLELAVEMGEKRIAELEKERDSANLVIAKFAKYIIDYDDIDQYSHQAVHRWEELKWFADEIVKKSEALKEQG